MTDIASGAPAAKRTMNFSIRKILGWLHLWTGIIFCIPFIALGVSGSILMIGHDLPNRFQGDAVVMADPSRTVNEIVAAAQAIAPEGVRLAGYDAPSQPGAKATVRFAQPRREGQAAPAGPPGFGNLRISVDPKTLEAARPQAPTPGANANQGFNLMRLMHDLHGHMMWRGPGRDIVGWLGVFMTFLGLSGIVMWWPRKGQWANAFKFSFGRSALKTNRDMHGAVGIWGLIVFVIVSFSGVYIAFPQPINAVVDAGPAVRDARGQARIPVTPIEGAQPLDVDGAIRLAVESVDGGVVRTVNLPPAPDQPIRVQLSRVGDYNGTPRATVIIDQWQNRVIEVRDPSAYGPIDKFLSWQRQMHAGNGLGWVWWILVFLSGFLPVLFVITGISMWWLKRRNRLRVQAQ